jgi:aminopeptidase YwaD
MRPSSLKPISSAALFLLVTACAVQTPAWSRISPKTDADSVIVLSDITYLSSDALEGRFTGMPGNDSAAAYIARRYAALKLVAPLPQKYIQPFDALSASDVHAGRKTPRKTQNVVAIVPGTDPVLRNEYVVVGAHYDHLGRTTDFSLDPEAKDAIRNGADDNASGTAAVMEIARLFSMRPARRSVMFVNFSGEELGVLGSAWFVEHSPVPKESIVAMINFDMIGRLRNDKLIVYGRGTASELKPLVDSVNSALPDARFSISGSDDGFGPSDHASFYTKNIPVLHFFTDIHDDYHRASDDIEKINAGGEARIINFARGVIEAVANRPAKLTFVRMNPPQQTMSARSGSQVYLGSVPDMAAGDTPGLRLSGVRPGSPAEAGGLKAGDIIIELGGKAVTDLYSYTDALYANKVGDKVKIVFMRDGKRMETEVTLGKRGG